MGGAHGSEGAASRISGAFDAHVISPIRGLVTLRSHAELDRQRLRIKIAKALEELAYREQGVAGPTGAWLSIAHTQLDHANQELASDRLVAARRCLLGAQQALTQSYTTSELDARAIELRAEAATIGGWQAGAIADLLAPSSPVDLATAVRTAMEIRDARLLDVGTNAGRRRDQAGRRLGALVVFIGVIWLLAAARVVPLDAGTTAGVIIFGALGGAFSTAIATHEGDAAPPASENFVSNWVTWLRPAIGSAAAVGAYAFLNAGVGVSAASPTAVFAIAFAAGFSERLVAQKAEETILP
jgi:hypothetical protein